MHPPSSSPENKVPSGRIAVALSGGVDSSVAAALLVEQGWDVVGVHLKLHDFPDSEKRDKSCCSVDDALDARQICSQLGIPFYVLDFTEVFREQVIQYFVDSYRQGRTTNPCVMCNKTIKHTHLLNKIREFGCEFLATGHYARIEPIGGNGHLALARPKDRRKDQTYFLFETRSEELPYLRYPLADYEKPHARAIAGEKQFITWDKPDSQEVCFVPSDYRDFLKRGMADTPAQPGDFINRAGERVGEHQGLSYYTVGQRRGLGISGPRPSYVIALRPETNQVVLGDEADLYADTMAVSGVNWVSCPPPTIPLEATVKVRYAHGGTAARILPVDSASVRVEFSEPVRAISPGQAAVFYEGDVLLGGGWIEPPGENESKR